MRNEIARFAAAVVVCGALLGCSVESPVSGDYFNDLDKVKGGEKPDPPVLISVTNPEANKLTLTFSTNGITDGDAGPNDKLQYLVYYWDEDPAGFGDQSEYYSVEYYIGYVKESDYDADPDTTPKTVSFNLSASFHGTLYFWMTSYDGGRESDHSNVESVDVP